MGRPKVSEVQVHDALKALGGQVASIGQAASLAWGARHLTGTDLLRACHQVAIRLPDKCSVEAETIRRYIAQGEQS